MKEYYRIGETASLMGITTQSALSFEEYAYSYMKAGASAVGGCCTTVAKHVEEVVRAKEETYKCNRHIYIYI